MKRFTRIFTSLLLSFLFLITITLLIRGYWAIDRFASSTSHPSICLANYPGRVEISAYWYPAGTPWSWSIQHSAESPQANTPWTAYDFETHPTGVDLINTRHSFFGFLFRTGERSTTGGESVRFDTPWCSIVCPTWFLTLATSISLMITATRSHRRWLHRPTCSYDLRTHKPNDNCPECGTPISNSPPIPAAYNNQNPQGA